MQFYTSENPITLYDLRQNLPRSEVDEVLWLSGKEIVSVKEARRLEELLEKARKLKTTKSPPAKNPRRS